MVQNRFFSQLKIITKFHPKITSQNIVLEGHEQVFYTHNFIFQALCEEFEQECSASLAQSIQRHLSEADQAKASGNENWWKAHEAAMLALGSVHEVIEGQIEEGKVDFDIKGFLENVVLNDAANPGMYIIFHILYLFVKVASK